MIATSTITMRCWPSSDVRSPIRQNQRHCTNRQPRQSDQVYNKHHGAAETIHSADRRTYYGTPVAHFGISIVVRTRPIPFGRTIPGADDSAHECDSGESYASTEGSCSCQEGCDRCGDACTAACAPNPGADASHAASRHLSEWIADHRRQEFDVVASVAFGAVTDGRFHRDAFQRGE